jgi:2-amino-4-hydroxy-6-hydroxymethyldihydropteridine diphosphokinase
MTRAFIGVGSNLENPLLQVQRALGELAALPASQLVASSSLYRSPPMGPADQPYYVNAVVELATELAAVSLLDELQAIEQQHRRIRTEHWGPRTLDLDILLYGNAKVRTPRLQIPHPGIGQRNFVLYPLAEIAPRLSIPGVASLQSLLDQCARKGLERLDDSALCAV